MVYLPFIQYAGYTKILIQYDVSSSRYFSRIAHFYFRVKILLVQKRGVFSPSLVMINIPIFYLYGTLYKVIVVQSVGSVRIDYTYFGISLRYCAGSLRVSVVKYNIIVYFCRWFIVVRNPLKITAIWLTKNVKTNGFRCKYT